MTVYVSIGNSDNKLTQEDWAAYQNEVFAKIYSQNAVGIVHGVWYSLPNVPYQNACICFEIEEKGVEHLKGRLRGVANEFRQDSIAWAVAETEMLRA